MSYQAEIDRINREMQTINPKFAVGGFEQCPQAMPFAAGSGHSGCLETLQILDHLFERALPKAEFEAFNKFCDEGLPGLKELLESDSLSPIVRILWARIKVRTIKQT